MIDFNEFERYLEARKIKRHFVQQDELLTNEEVDVLLELTKEYTLSEVMNCFEPTKANQRYNVFYVEAECARCKTLDIVQMTKTSLTNYLKHNKYATKSKRGSYNQFICVKCEAEKHHLQKNEEINYMKKVEENTTNFIKIYLNPNNTWKKDVKFYERWNLVIYQNVDWQKVREYIRDMNYYEFLKTPYWNIVSEKKKRQAGFKCQLCNSNINLATHHRTYEISGDEIHALNDLIVLCDDCHKTHHEIE